MMSSCSSHHTIIRRATDAMATGGFAAVIWQRRFREHAIREEEIFERHEAYIQNNPVNMG